jgi:hypothetical protein
MICLLKTSKSLQTEFAAVAHLAGGGYLQELTNTTKGNDDNHDDNNIVYTPFIN